MEGTAKSIVIGGREFISPPYTTVEHDIWLMDQITRAGLREVHRGEDESVERFVDRLLGELIASKALLLILGGMMLPAGKTPEDWSPAMAEEHAEHLRRCHGEADKQAIYDQVVALLLGFFEAGAISVGTSPKSSTSDPAVDDEARATAAS